MLTVTREYDEHHFIRFMEQLDRSKRPKAGIGNLPKTGLLRADVVHLVRMGNGQWAMSNEHGQ